MNHQPPKLPQIEPTLRFIKLTGTDKEFHIEVNKLANKYTPVNGCDNCWGDLGEGCTEKCREEFRLRREFLKDLYALILKLR